LQAVSSMPATAATPAARNSREGPRLRSIRYFLFIGGSSIHIEQYALGLALAAFLITLIFIIVSYAALAVAWANEMSAESKLRL